jgi:hypothetical protein
MSLRLNRIETIPRRSRYVADSAVSFVIAETRTDFIAADPPYREAGLLEAPAAFIVLSSYIVEVGVRFRTVDLHIRRDRY